MPIFGGNVIAECGFAGDGPALILARPNAFAATKDGGACRGDPGSRR